MITSRLNIQYLVITALLVSLLIPLSSHAEQTEQPMSMQIIYPGGLANVSSDYITEGEFHFGVAVASPYEVSTVTAILQKSVGSSEILGTIDLKYDSGEWMTFPEGHWRGIVSTGSLPTGEFRLSITAEDIRGNRTWVAANFIYESDVSLDSGPWLSQVDSLENSVIMDVWPDRILFLNRATNQLGIKDRQSGDVAMIPEILDKTPEPQIGYLTPQGAIFLVMAESVTSNELYEWKDGLLINLGKISISSLKVNRNYAIYVQDVDPDSLQLGNKLVLRNLLFGTNEEIKTVGKIIPYGNDLTETGEVALWSIDKYEELAFRPVPMIYAYKNGALTRITFYTDEVHDSPLINGDNIIYGLVTYWRESYNSLALNNSNRKEIIADQYNRDKDLKNGWIAFTNRTYYYGYNYDLWVRSPDGGAQIVSTFGTPINIKFLAENGDVAFSDENNLYLNRNLPDGRSENIRISSSFLKPIRIDGKWFGTFGSGLYAIKEEITPPTISDVYPADGETIDVNDPEISAIITAEGSWVDPASLIVKVDGQELQASYDEATMTVTAATNGLANGSHSLLIRAADNEGDISDYAGSFTVQYVPDTDAPVIESVFPADRERITTRTPTISAIVYDESSGVNPSSIKVKVGDQILESTYDEAAMTVTATASGLKNGRHKLKISAKDHAGNRTNSKTFFIVTVPSPLHP